MAIGPLGRILAQVVVVAGSAFGRAVVRAYKDAAQRGAAAGGSASSPQRLSLRPRMSSDEARKILGFQVGPGSKTPTKEEILARYDRLYHINAPSENFGGSPYLQKRVAVARAIMLEECEREATTKSGFSSSSRSNPGG